MSGRLWNIGILLTDRTIMPYWSLIFPLSSLFYRMWRHFSLDDLDTQKVPGVAECSPPPLAAACVICGLFLSFKRDRWPPIFFTFLIWFYHFLPAVNVLKKSVRGNFWARTSLNATFDSKFVAAIPFVLWHFWWNHEMIWILVTLYFCFSFSSC